MNTSYNFCLFNRFKVMPFIILIFLSNAIVIKNESQFNAIFRIDSKENNYSLKMEKNVLLFLDSKESKEELFRITSIKDDLYYIIYKPLNQFFGIDDKGEIKLYNQDNKNKNEIADKIKWKFIKINDNEYSLQNLFNGKFLEMKNKKENGKRKYYPICISKINTDKIDKIGKAFKFSFYKICEEVHIKPEHIPLIENEPVDILIKYIDLTDKTLKREGIKQIDKDFDNDELKYSVRSVLQYIPWIRKIFIVMPNEKVRYFKPIEEIRNKIVYVKDKDLIGFDSANIAVFLFNLHNMEKFGISQNFILIDDDCFFGKPINKTQFFYYDEENKKVVPSVVTDDPCQLIKKNLLNEYNKLYNKRSSIKPHTFNQWKLSQLASYKLILDNFQEPLTIAGFTHNAVPVNIEDLREIHDLIVNKYQYAKEFLYSKERIIHDLQAQSFFNTYGLTIKKRKLNSIPYAYFDIAFLKDKKFDIELFVLNTSGDRKYTSSMKNNVKTILENKYSIPTPFEIETKQSCDKNNEEYEKLKKLYEDSENQNKELKKKNEEILKEKESNEKLLSEAKKMNEKLMKNLNEIIKEQDVKTQSDIIIKNNNETNNQSLKKEDGINNDININTKEFIFLKNYFKISIIIFIFIFFVCILNYKRKNKYQKENIISYNNKDKKLNLIENINDNKLGITFERLSNDEPN